MYSNQKLNWETGEFDTSYLSNNYCYFELIEDNNIDIDSIEELNDTGYDEENMTSEEKEYYHNITREQQNTILRALKQLNKEIKSIKEK